MSDLGAVAGPGAVAELSGLISAEIPFSAVDGPGNRYVVFLQGCQFDCLVCHNPCTIPLRPRGLDPTPVSVLAARIREAAPFLTGVTISGGEATLQSEFIVALFTALRADPVTRGLSLLVDSNGDADPEVWARLAPVSDGVMIDLKALDDEMHYVLTAASNVRVLAGIEQLAELGALAEVRLLLVPGLNDADATLEATVAWLARAAPGVPIRRNLFRRHGARPCARDLAEPDGALAAHYAQVVPDRAPEPLITTG